MIDALKNIAEKYTLSIQEDLKEYDLSFDIRNIPNNKITLTKDTTSIGINASYEFLWGTSEKPSHFSGNNTDKYICWIKCKIEDSSVPDFRITESSTIDKWFRSKPMKIYCKDTPFKTKLNGFSQIKAIFEQCKESAELSPSISSINKNGQLELDINFQSFLPYYDIFEHCIELCHELEKLK